MNEKIKCLCLLPPKYPHLEKYTQTNNEEEEC